MKKVHLITIGILIVGFAGWQGWQHYNYVNKIKFGPEALDLLPEKRTPFESCVHSGYPVLETYPRQCKTSDGRTFVEELAQITPTYINATSGVITVTTPTPNAVTGKEFEVRGSARGWYFEGSFPIVILDQNNKVISMTPAQAQSDWMTSDPVAFIAKIKIPNSYIGKATVILKKDNPSGLPENDASMSFPITIEY